MPSEVQLSAVARRQHGLFTLGQVLECGFTRPVVRRLLTRRVWQEIAPRVYRVAASRAVDWRQRQMALVLATGGVSAELGAAALHGLADPPPRPEILLARSRRGELDAVVRTSTDLPPIDCTEIDGIPATTVARTLIDLGGRLHGDAFEDMLDAALVRRLVSPNRLRSRAEALWAPRRSGCAIVLARLAERRPTDARAANVWEAKVVRIVRELGLPDPKINHRVRVGGRVRYLDLAWPAAKVAVEFDGFVPHSTRRVFDDDRARQNDLVADGWTVFRVTATMLRDPEPAFAPIVAAVGVQSSAV
jgi:very-short-patch-repair endonuclease